MIINYEYDNNFFSFKLKDNSNYSPNKILGFFKISLKKNIGLSLNKYMEYKGYKLEKCRLCNIGDVPINVLFEIKNNILNVIDFNYTKKIYCYGNNKDCYGLKLNSNSFEFISKVNLVSIDDAKKILKENNKSPFYKENWKSEIEYKKSQSRSLDYYIRKYGEYEGRHKYNEHINKISISNSIEGYINKYGEYEGKEKFKEISKLKDSMSFRFFLSKNNGNYNKALFEYEERKKSVDISLKSMINRYGDQGVIKYNNMIEKSKLTTINNPNYKEICKSKAITLDKMVKKYGNDLGKIKYNEWLVKITVPITRASKKSLEVFNPLIEILIKDYNIINDDIYIGIDNKNEFFLRKNNEIFFYDFVIKSKKIIIEYNGTAFHPKNENSIWKNPFNNEDAKTAYNRQKRKIKLAEERGYNVLEVWSDDDNNLEKSLNFIKKIIIK